MKKGRDRGAALAVEVGVKQHAIGRFLVHNRQRFIYRQLGRKTHKSARITEPGSGVCVIITARYKGCVQTVSGDMMDPLQRVTERVMRAGNPEQRSVPTPLLTLEEFFDGNDFVGSIGCNLLSEPSPAVFLELLVTFRSMPEVSDVRVQITCVDDPGRDWPFSDTIWIMTSASPEEVRNWFPNDLAPDAAWEGWVKGMKYEACPVAEGHRIVGVWYD